MSSGGVVRSSAEMTFAASLQPCPNCGAAPGKLDLYGDGNRWSLAGKCPSCGKPRNFDFHSDGYPVGKQHPYLELGGPEPSQVITPAQFEAELDRLIPMLRDDPATISTADWFERGQLADRALTCVLELRKFPPAQQPEKLDGWYQRIRALTERFTADAPRIWLVRGNGKLRPSEEVRALFNQASTLRALTAADLERWLSVRADLAKDSSANAIRVWEDGSGTHAELTYARATLDELKDALGKIQTTSPGHATAELTVANHRVRADIESADKRVTKLTLHFTPLN